MILKNYPIHILDLHQESSTFTVDSPVVVEFPLGKNKPQIIDSANSKKKCIEHDLTRSNPSVMFNNLAKD